MGKEKHMVEIRIAYEGDLHCVATHQPSGTQLHTDAPKDNMGRGESFSPTDLVATALGSCMLTVMGIAARSHGIDLQLATAVVEKEMLAAPARKIGMLRVKIHVPVTLDEEQKKMLEKAAMQCPVHKSLHPDVKIPIEFMWA